MAHGAMTPRVRGVVGLTTLVAWAGLLIAALAGPAAAHESTVEPEPEDEGLSCPDLAEGHAGGQAWQQFTIDDVAGGDHSESHQVDGVGTVTVTVHNGKTFDWSSTFGIDAIYVQGRDANLSPNSYFYLYAPDAAIENEATEDVDLGTPPWHEWDTNKIKSISFCFDNENETPPTSDETIESTTTSVESTTTSMESTTTSSTDTTMPSTSRTPIVSLDTTPPGPTVPMATPSDTLPKTGSDNTGLLLALGGVLVLGGGALLATTRIFRGRSG